MVWCYPDPLALVRRCTSRHGRELRRAVFVATLVRRREHLVAGASASKVYIADGELHLSSSFALLGFPRSSTVVLPPPPGLVPEVIRH